MAAAAGPGRHAHMVEPRGCPAGRDMAGFAGVGTGNMVGSLASGGRAVMAGKAAT